MTEQPPEVVTVLMTAPNSESAETLARVLVEERLAACANVVPDVVSLFRWEGKVQREEEALLIVKTTPDGLEAMRARAVELHPYEVPEVLALPVIGGHAPYRAWVADQVGDAPPADD